MSPMWQTIRRTDETDQQSGRTWRSGTASPRASATRARTGRSSAGPTGSRSCSRTGARGRLRLHQPRRPRETPRPDRRGAVDPREGARAGPGLLLRGRQRHHPAGHRPRRGRGALRARRRRPHRGRRHGPGDHRLRHPWRPRAQAHARQDRHVHRHVRAIADRYGCPVLDLWSLKTIQDRRAWDGDRLHLSPEGHTRVALRAGQVLGLEVPADPDQPWPPLPPRGTLEMRRDNIHWAREYLVPWIGRRLRGESSGRPRGGEAARSAAAVRRRAERLRPPGRAGMRSSTPPAKTSYSGSVSRCT